MFDVSFAEIFLFSLIALVILGPNRLPEVLRTLGLWIGRMRRIYYNVRQEIDREVGMDDIRRQLHNEQITSEFKKIESEASELKRNISSSVEDAMREGEAEMRSGSASDPKDDDGETQSARA